MFNIGLIGKGYWGSKIVRELLKNPLIESLKIASRSSLLQPNDLFKDSKITHIFIATPVYTHYELCKQALLAGKHVMCEKNFTETLEQVKELAEIARERNLNITIDYIHTFSLPKIDISRVSYIKIEYKQYGRFRNEHVMSILGSHALSVLGSIIDLDKIKWKETISCLDSDNQNVTICATKWTIGDKDIYIDLSLEEEGIKIRDLTLYNGTHCLSSESFAKPNGLYAMIDSVLNGGNNTSLALQVTKLVEQVVQND